MQMQSQARVPAPQGHGPAAGMADCLVPLMGYEQPG